MPECGASNNAVPLTDEEAIRILTEPTAPDHFTVLRRRRGQPLSDEQIVQILQEDSPKSSISPLPTAARSTEGVLLTLGYCGRAHDQWQLIATPLTPLRYRIIGAVLWLAVAALMAAVIYRSVAEYLTHNSVP